MEPGGWYFPVTFSGLFSWIVTSIFQSSKGHLAPELISKLCGKLWCRNFVWKKTGKTRKKNNNKKKCLGVCNNIFLKFARWWFQIFLCSTLLGDIIQFDKHIFQMGWNYQPVWGIIQIFRGQEVSSWTSMRSWISRRLPVVFFRALHLPMKTTQVFRNKPTGFSRQEWGLKKQHGAVPMERRVLRGFCADFCSPSCPGSI